MTNLEATNAVKAAINNGYSIVDLAVDLGISRPTLYKRIIEHNWKKSEKALLINLLKVKHG